MSFPLKIDGVDIPAPSGYKFNEADFVENSDRNAQGYANWDTVRFNVGRIDLTWAYIDRTQIRQITLAIRNKKEFQATFLNTNTGEIETRTFYSGDRSNELARFVSALEYWSTLTVPFVEV